MAQDGKIESLNFALREMIPNLRDVADANPTAEIMVRVLTFSTGARWHVRTPCPISEFRWRDLTAGGQRDMGLALSMVSERLKAPEMPQRGLPPLLVLISDGSPTDDFDAGLKSLLDEPWGRKAVRVGIAIGANADLNVLQKFIGNPSIRPLQANSPESIIRQLRFASTQVALDSKREKAVRGSRGLDSAPRNKLLELIAQYPSIYQDARRCEAFLRDLCGSHKREISVLVSALEAGIVTDLMAPQIPSSPQVLLARLAKQLEDELGLTGIAARWAVESWAIALGVVSSSEAEPGDERNSESRESWDLNDNIIYRIREPAPSRETIRLRVKRGVEHKPSEPYWYKREAEKIRRYVVSSRGKPILLTGYGHFGGSYLTEWAINESAKELAEQTRTSQETVVVKIPADLVGRDSKGLWLRINKWVIEVWEDPMHQKFVRRYKEKLKVLGQYPFFSLRELTTTERGNVLRAGVHVSGPVGSGELTSEGKQQELKEVYVPLDHQTQLERLLQALAVSLPSEPASRLVRFLQSIRNDGIPYRIVLLLDRIDDWTQLKGLEPLLDIGGALKIITVTEKSHYDTWNEDNRSAIWIERSFSVIKCPPVLDESVSEELCRFYFQLNEDDLQKPLVRDFIDGLNFYCFGSPGNMAKALTEHWERFIWVDGAGHETLTLSDSEGLMSQYHIWAKANRLLVNEWKEIIGNYAPFEAPDHPTLGEYQSRARVFLYLLIKHVIKSGNKGFTERQLLAFCQQTEAEFNLEISVEYLREVCRKLIESTLRAGFLMQSPVEQEG
jgi:uncharacterized protein YegL